MSVVIGLSLESAGYVKGASTAERAVKSLDGAQRRASRTTGGLGQASNGLGNKLKGLTGKVGDLVTSLGPAGIVAAGGAAVAALGKVAFKALDVAASVEDSRDAFDAVFGDLSSTVDSFAQDFGGLVGVSDRTARDFLTNVQGITKGIGFSNEKAAELSMGIVALGGDLASFTGQSNERAQSALSSALLGEAEALKSLGIVLTAAETETVALAESGKNAAKELTDQEKAAARYSIILDKMGKQGSLGDAARTSMSLRTQLNRLKAAYENVRDAIVPVIAKALKPFIDKMVELATKISDNREKIVEHFEKIYEGAKESLEKLFGTIDTTVRDITEVFGTTGGGGKATLVGSLKFVGSVFSILPIIASEALNLIFGLIRDNVVRSVASIQTLGELLRGRFGAAWHSAKEAVQGWKDSVVRAIDTGGSLRDRFTEIWESTDELSAALDSPSGRSGGSVTAATTAAMDAMQTFLETPLPISEPLEAVQALNTELIDIPENTMPDVKSSFNRVQTAAEEAFQLAGEAVNKLKDGPLKNMLGAIGEMREKFDDIKDRVEKLVGPGKNQEFLGLVGGILGVAIAGIVRFHKAAGGVGERIRETAIGLEDAAERIQAVTDRFMNIANEARALSRTGQELGLSPMEIIQSIIQKIQRSPHELGQFTTDTGALIQVGNLEAFTQGLHTREGRQRARLAVASGIAYLQDYFRRHGALRPQEQARLNVLLELQRLLDQLPQDEQILTPSAPGGLFPSPPREPPPGKHPDALPTGGPTSPAPGTSETSADAQTPGYRPQPATETGAQMLQNLRAAGLVPTG